MKNILILTLSGLLMLLSCSRKEIPEPTVFSSTAKTIIASTEEIRPHLESYGTVSYTRKADITVSVEGTFENLLYEEGDSVSSGAEVARLSNIQLNIQMAKARAAVLSARASLELAEVKYQEGRSRIEAKLLGLEKTAIKIEQKKREVAEMERTHGDQMALFEIGGVTESTLRSSELSLLSAQAGLAAMEKDWEIRNIGLRDQDITARGFSIPEDPLERRNLLTDMNTRTLKAEVDVARASLSSALTEEESAQALLNELNLRSPISGIIGVRSPEVGEKASRGDTVYTVFATEDVHVVFPVQESDAVSVRRGQSADVKIDAFPDDFFPATVDRISPVVDPQSGNVTIRALIEGTDGRLRPGMFARVTVETGNLTHRILLPETVLSEKRGSKGRIFTVRNGKAFAKEVMLGHRFGDQIEILTNLEEGELVIDNPSPILREGEEVIVEQT